MIMLGSTIFACLLVSVFSYRAYPAKNVHYMQMGRGADSRAKPVSLSYGNCNNVTYPIELKGLKISPDPIIIGNASNPPIVSADVDVTRTIGGKIDYDLDILMEVGGEFMTVCQILPEYVCHGQDVCSMLEKLSAACPAALTEQGLNCKCPVKKKEYSIKNFIIAGLPNPKIDLSGRFKIELKLIQGKTMLMCVDIIFCIKSCD